MKASARRMGRILLQVAIGLSILYALLLAARNLVTLVDLQSSRFDGTVARGQFEDYVAFYAAGKLVLDGRGTDIYEIEELATVEHQVMGREVGGTGTLAFFNPPFVALLFAPLTILPVATAGAVLMVINLGLLIFAAAVIHHHLQIRKRWISVVYWLGIATFEPAFWLIAHNQLSMFLVLGFLGFYLFQRQGKPIYSGLALALLLVKPQVAFLALVILVWKRQWNALLPFSAVASVLVVASMAVSEPSVLWEYPSFLIESTSWEGSRGIDTASMYGWNGFLSTITTYGESTHLVLTGLCTVGTVALGLFSLRGRWDPAPATFPLLIGLTVLAAVLVNPHVYLQDTVLVGLSASLGFVAWRGHKTMEVCWGILTFGLWLLASGTTMLQVDHGLNLLTPLIAAMFVAFAVRFLRLDSTETQETPTNLMYGVPEAGQPESRIA